MNCCCNYLGFISCYIRKAPHWRLVRFLKNNNYNTYTNTNTINHGNGRLRIVCFSWNYLTNIYSNVLFQVWRTFSTLSLDRVWRETNLLKEEKKSDDMVNEKKEEDKKNYLHTNTHARRIGWAYFYGYVNCIKFKNGKFNKNKQIKHWKLNQIKSCFPFSTVSHPWVGC